MSGRDRPVWRGLALAAPLLAGFMASAAAQDADPALVEKGRYIAIAADCAACHTNPDGGQPFAGGYSITSPLGVIVATNITPSRTSGIGAYTEAQFARAIRNGVRADGAHLYPAMPYTSYAQITDEDVHALYAFFMHGVAPVDGQIAATRLPFPFDIRLMMLGWNFLFLDDARFTPDPSRGAEWNRGKYLADTLEHCGACHTPRNFLMAEIASRAYGGASLGSWFAPNITADPASGVGGWSDEQLAHYLATGRAAGSSQAAGPMAEAVTNSLQHLTPEDIRAIVTYIRSVPPIHDAGDAKTGESYGQPAVLEAALRGALPANTQSVPNTGESLFSAYCASCHQPSGAGTPDHGYPALMHNTATGGPHPDNLVAAILFGVDRKVGNEHVLMPRFDEASFVQSLSDPQVSAIAGYVLKQFGNPAALVTPAQVAIVRRGGPPSPLLKLAPLALPALVLAGLAVLALILWLLSRRRRGPGLA
jgi:fructose 5-dehydrogenase cytochrome subunit